MIPDLRSVKKGIIEVPFPNVCVACNLKLSISEKFVCKVCLYERFERANPEQVRCSGEILLPEGITIQHALWIFDKGGELQELFHHLKYSRLVGIGEDMGEALGNNLLENEHFKVLNEPVLIPVPLHPKKKRIRGYNQAYHISKGMENVMDVSIISEEAVTRIKNTKTQTGFSLEKRRRNIAEAFYVNKDELIKGRDCIIVDDVFTTGATAFELAKTLTMSGAVKIGIVTVAQA